MTLLERVLEHEGFKASPYQDTQGVWTIGHGLTYLTEDESEFIVDCRLEDILERLHIEYDFEDQIMDVLAEMVFQMGWTGVHKFRKMFAALDANDYALAADEMLDSKWATQTPNRARVLSDIVRGEG